MSTSRTESAASSSSRVKVLAFSGALGGFLFGFDSSVVNGAVDSIQKSFGLSSAMTGFAVACALLGCAAGAWVAGPVSNRWGRTKAMVLGSVFFLVSSLGAGLAFGVWDLIIWRFIGGLGIGIASVTAPAYIAEISPKDSRGRLGSMQQLAITIGIFVALLSDAVIANSAGGAGSQLWFGVEAWRWMFIVGLIPALVYGVVSWGLPESPRSLVLQDKNDEAKKVLATIVPPEKVESEMSEIKLAIEEDRRANSGSIRGTALGLRPIVWVGIVMAILQQFVGINVIFYYSTTLWSSVGFDESDSFMISVITSVINVLVTLIAIGLVDKIGRRPLLLGGSIGMFVSLAIMAISFTQAVTVDGNPSLPGAWGPLALIFANVFVISFGATWGPLLWLMLGEVFPNTIRAKAMGLSTAANWLANFAVSMLFPVLAGFSLAFSYGLFALFALISLPFAYFFIPETKGVALEETDSLTVPRRQKARMPKL
ncbi:MULTISPECIES: sugar porter family MFS transporter [Kocuria]|uniref:sugar porter family MFS transporter n=1 Tax=Kocuria TaxID=57493 RepID=UPI000660EC62|nr:MULTISPECIES: sugar porter family MFS transporter [Kocuria]MCT1368030.1 sugar porter family MFS transporter [Rothia sp. p3-SID1597]RUQ21701.1 sugar porter family MFS transporter [Kocuria sp. HSID16901]